MDCPKCGVQNLATAHYCINCGTKMDANSVPSKALVDRLELGSALLWLVWVAIAATVFGAVADVLQHPRTIVEIVTDPQQSHHVEAALVVVAGLLACAAAKHLFSGNKRQ